MASRRNINSSTFPAFTTDARDTSTTTSGQRSVLLTRRHSTRWGVSINPSPGACGEDGELGVRLTAAGRRTLGLPRATGRHLHKLNLQNLIVNDWRKGRIALQNRAASKGRLSDNKHAGPRDILSVILAVVALGAVPGVFCAMIGLPAFWALPIGIALDGYCAPRRDVMAQFATQGHWFSFRAFWVMLTLDLVRWACVMSRVFETQPSLPSREAQRRPTE